VVKEMRSYIFTSKERQVIGQFLEGAVGPANLSVRQIRYRLRRFEALVEDVQLYLKLKKKFEQQNI